MGTKGRCPPGWPGPRGAAGALGPSHARVQVREGVCGLAEGTRSRTLGWLAAVPGLCCECPPCPLPRAPAPRHGLLPSPSRRRGRPAVVHLCGRPARAARGPFGGQLLQSGPGQPRGPHPDPIVSKGDHGQHHPGWGRGSFLSCPICSAQGPPHITPPQPWGHRGDCQTGHAQPSGGNQRHLQAAPGREGASRATGGVGGGLGLREASSGPRARTPCSPALVSGGPPRPSLLPERGWATASPSTVSSQPCVSPSQRV